MAGQGGARSARRSQDGDEDMAPRAGPASDGHPERVPRPSRAGHTIGPPVVSLGAPSPPP